MTEKFITQQIREAEGKFISVSDRFMIHAGVERTGRCQACGHAIKIHSGVQAPASLTDNEDDEPRLMWVGSTCFHLLCSEDAKEIDLEAGATWDDDGREYIIPTAEWMAELKDAAIYHKTLHGQTVIYRHKNNFLASIHESFGRYGQLTMRQYEAANKAMK